MHLWNTHIYSYTSFTDSTTWSPQDLAGRIEGQDLEESRKDETLAWTCQK